MRSTGGNITYTQAGVSCFVGQESGKIEVSESKGALNMSTSYGDIKIKSCEGILNVDTDYGDISGTNIKALGPYKPEYRYR